MKKPNECTRRTALGLIGTLPVVSKDLIATVVTNQESNKPAVSVSESAHRDKPYDAFKMRGDRIITEEEHFGIINGVLTAGINYRDVAGLSGLYAPPYASSDFLFEFRLFGERVLTRQYDWRPIEVHREGQLEGVAVSTSTLLVSGKRGALLSVTLRNTTAHRLHLPVQLGIMGSFENVKYWGFPRPDTTKNKTSIAVERHRITRQNAQGAVVVGSDLDNLTWEESSEWSSHWVTKVEMQPGERRTHYVAFTLGPRKDSELLCDQLLKDPDVEIRRSVADSIQRSQELFARLPVLEASNPLLSDYYTRSLQHLVLNRWTVPEFVLNPYYSTGSIKGGCVGCYLWDYASVPELMPLYDPAATRQHIKQFLNVDIAKHFLFNPVDGQGDGPTYLVNQEKIIGCIYYYVLHTGDVGFLEESLNGKSVLDWAVFHASHGDDLNKAVILSDYGEDVSHLELRHHYKYNHVLPDVNGGRYINYVRASKLAALAGKERQEIVARAQPLKELLKQRLWDAQNRWLGFQRADGSLELRYTNIIFTLIGTGALDKDLERELISHLNEREFLSDYGLHSISKLDPAYDQVDIDHGGGGSYVAFPGMIAECLYKGGYPEPAEDILKRTLWWAQRLPYWGDSIVANQIDYRRDTPLQCAMDAAAGAQCVIFGMCGIKAEPNGDVTISPHPPEFSPSLRLSGVKLRGFNFDVKANRSDFEVEMGKKVIRSKIGTPVVLRADA